ncbi:MAG TPA: translation initiation factor IF-3 [Candidatus Babeliales bacterium]|nr:translation initiation factor IF-3 [Candidatus Babeliales bacterium]
MKDRILGSRNIPLINEKIRFPLMQLILPDGTNLGVITREQALQKAHEYGLDLVIVTERGGDAAPIAKIVDFGKTEYEKKKKQTAAKKNQKVIKVKEIKVRPKIGEHDLGVKMRQGIDFLQDGMRLKITVSFRGREKALRNERGKEIFEKIDFYFKQADLQNLVQEKDMRTDEMWSRIYYLKDL